jgi:hypothetical protein
MNHVDEREPERLTPFAFVMNDRVSGRYSLGSVVIPLFFILVKARGIRLVTPEQSEQIVETLSTFWPVWKDQYQAIIGFGGAQEASNFALFCVVLLIFFGGLTAYAVHNAILNSKIIEKPGQRELVLGLMAAPAIVFVLFYDYVYAKPESLFGFYIDSLGFYYVRQWAMMFGIWLILSTLLTLLVSKLKRQR